MLCKCCSAAAILCCWERDASGVWQRACCSDYEGLAAAVGAPGFEARKQQMHCTHQVGSLELRICVLRSVCCAVLFRAPQLWTGIWIVVLLIGTNIGAIIQASGGCRAY